MWKEIVMKNLFLNLDNEIEFYKEFKIEKQANVPISVSDFEKFKQAKSFLKHVSLFYTLFIIEKVLETIMCVSVMIIAPLWDKGYIFGYTSWWNLLFFPYAIIYIFSLILTLMDWRFPFGFSKNELKRALN